MIDGSRLKELRINRGLTQSELGKILNVTKATICCYEKGNRTPTIENLIDLVNYFGISADYLIGHDKIVSIKNKRIKKVFMSKEEIMFIEELRKNKYLSEVLLEDPIRSLELLSKKIG
ncbi:MAG: helix-turn-helix transcriptional regulator [Bacilli bacterium]|nr:helix-turn-helix transcriptional regulator [Bacilli bacterium]